MSLDLNQVAAQIQHISAQIKAGEIDRIQRIKYALDTLKTLNIPLVKEKIEKSRNTWLVADVPATLKYYHQCSPCPPDYIVMATDGSHIDIDRHVSVPCGLINIGSVVIIYGKNPEAELTNQPKLYMGDSIWTEGPLLSVKRTVDECVALADLAEMQRSGLPGVCLLDGSLVLFGLVGQAYTDSIKEMLLNDGLLQALDRIETTGMPVASYISFPRSTDVVNFLRMAVCPYESPDCDRDCQRDNRNCDIFAGILDRDLFEELLVTGQRSDIFASKSSIVQQYYREHKVYFFYLKLGNEVARIEIPCWVAENELLCDQVHSSLLEQCNRGMGYPIALAEAHEKAVLSGYDREQFWNMVNMVLVETNLPFTVSAKSRSKRTRWV